MKRPARHPKAGAGSSPAYKLFERAIREKKQIVCIQNGKKRELCPIVLGHKKDGREVALTFQFAGESESGLPPGGDWRCLYLATVTDVRLRDGRWHSGKSHERSQSCVEIVDLDVNPSSPYNPRRRLGTRRRSFRK
jgi:hypothetical protein